MDQTFCVPVQPPPQKLLPEHAQTLERYAWESFDPHSQGEHTIIYYFSQKNKTKQNVKYINWLFTGNKEIALWVVSDIYLSQRKQFLSPPLATFLPENVFLLLQSVVVSFISHMLVHFTGFPEASCLRQEKWSSRPLCGSERCPAIYILWAMDPFF